MSLLEYSEIRERKIIIHEGEPCEVIESHVARTQQRKPQNQVKLKSLTSGRTWNTTFHASDKVPEAEISKRDIKFLYHNKDEYWFSDLDDPKNRFKLDVKLIGDAIKFLKDNITVTAIIFEDEDEDGEEKIINIKLPIKIEFKIKDAPPAIKGNTASGGNKPVTLENGAVVNVPLFIEAGETIRVNTETGEYVERV